MATPEEYLEELISRKNNLEDELDHVVDAILNHMNKHYGMDAKVALPRRKRIQPERFIIGRPRQFAVRMCSVLIHEGKPLNKGQLMIAVIRQGVQIATRNPSRYVETALYRNPDLFYHIPNRGYWVRGVKEP